MLTVALYAVVLVSTFFACVYITAFFQYSLRKDRARTFIALALTLAIGIGYAVYVHHHTRHQQGMQNPPATLPSDFSGWDRK